MPDLTGRTAIVAGGTTLIGKGVVEALVRSGADVVVAGPDTERVRASATDLGATFVPMPDRSDPAPLVAEAVEVHGGIDIVVDLAAIYLDLGFDTSRVEWRMTLDAKLSEMAALVAAARPHLAASGRAGVVTFSSISSRSWGECDRPTSRAAIVRHTWSLAMDLAPEGVRVNSVSPGWTGEAMVDEADDPTDADAYESPGDVMGEQFRLTCRVANPARLGAVVAYLVSDEAEMVTGADWAPSGGYPEAGTDVAGLPAPRLAM